MYRDTFIQTVYLKDFGIDVIFFDFPMTDRKTKDNILCKAIRTNKKVHYESILNLIEIPNEPSKEYYRGFLAGFYDAEGNSEIYIKRVYNTDENLIDLFLKGLKHCRKMVLT